MKKISLLLLVLCCFNKLSSHQEEYIHLGLLGNGFGMFSVVFYVAGAMYEYETKNYAGVNVDFGKMGPYYQEECGLNWWNYYFEPMGFDLQHSKKRDLTDLQAVFTTFIEFRDRKANHELINKYIHVKPHILEKVDDFVRGNFGSKYVIGVHYRGTDKIAEAPLVKYQLVAKEIEKIVQNKNLKEDYLIFLATDKQAIVDYLEKSFSGKIITYDCQRATSFRPIHIYGKNKYLLGEEAIIDSLLLSKCDLLIRTSSNLSLFSMFVNPELPVIELNKRY